ncbi:hypothetical protein HDU98_012106 [Podochytrium sp. JEL0797]|nr:hypothetical protein HDU98_012106 [Podochytrium sp. JEL0797]
MFDTSVLAAFVLGGLAAGMAALYLATPVSPKKTKKKNKAKKDSSDPSPAANNLPTPTPTASTPPAPSATRPKPSKKSKKTKQVDVGVLDPTWSKVAETPNVPAKKSEPSVVADDTPFPPLKDTSSRDSKKIKSKTHTMKSKDFSYAGVAVADPKPVVVPVVPSSTAPRAYDPAESSAKKPVVDMPLDSDREDEDDTPKARVLKFQEKEQVDDGWIRVTDEKAPTIRIGAPSKPPQHSFPTKSAPTPASQLTKTQLNNQRKAEKAKEEKEQARLIQEARKNEYRREVAQAESKKRAVEEAMKRGKEIEKQRIAMARKPADGKWEDGTNSAVFWE